MGGFYVPILVGLLISHNFFSFIKIDIRNNYKGTVQFLPVLSYGQIIWKYLVLRKLQIISAYQKKTCGTAFPTIKSITLEGWQFSFFRNPKHCTTSQQDVFLHTFTILFPLHFLPISCSVKKSFPRCGYYINDCQIRDTPYLNLI